MIELICHFAASRPRPNKADEERGKQRIQNDWAKKRREERTAKRGTLFSTLQRREGCGISAFPLQESTERQTVQARIFSSCPARRRAGDSAAYSTGAAIMAAMALSRDAGSLLPIVTTAVSMG